MSYNHGAEEKKFQLMEEETREAFEKYGVSLEKYEELYEFDRVIFNSDRRFYERNIKIGGADIETGDTTDDEIKINSDLGRKCLGSIYAESKFFEDGMRGCLECVDEKWQFDAMKEFTLIEWQVLYLFKGAGYAQEEVGRMLGIDIKDVRKVMSDIRKKIKKHQI